MSSLIEIQDVCKTFDGQPVVNHMNLSVYEGEFLTLLGPSGCGKTTLLRMIGGFLTPDSGDIKLEGKSIVSLPPYEREVNTVFQSYALFPNFTVRENIAFGLKMKKLPKKEIDERVTQIIEMCQLEMLQNRKPTKLSGGQQQRVAIARSLINKPKVLLLDEPLGALDLQLRKRMQISLKRLQRKFGMTYIYVTHDQEEAMTLSDRIAVINNGCIEQLGTPNEVYGKPATSFSARFLGESNFFSGEISMQNKKPYFSTESTMIPLPTTDFSTAQKYELSIRPEFITLSTNNPEAMQTETHNQFFLQAKVTSQNFLGPFTRISVVTPTGHEIHALEPSGSNSYRTNQEVTVSWQPENATIIKYGR
jgi:spermidine/putrescine transport system ATP-binding protein